MSNTGTTPCNEKEWHVCVTDGGLRMCVATRVRHDSGTVSLLCAHPFLTAAALTKQPQRTLHSRAHCWSKQ